MKKFVSLLFCIVLLLNLSPAHAKTGEQHEKDLEKAFFGKTINTDIKSRPVDNSDPNILFGYLEDAIYLCIDQTGSDGQQWLNELNNDFGVSGLPTTVKEFSVRGGDDHQAYTHFGWDFKKYEDKSHWAIRQNILLATVSKVFDIPIDDNICLYVSKLIYYIHVLGDTVADSYSNRNNIIQMAKFGDDYGLLQELRKCIKVLFRDQRTSWLYCQTLVKIDSYRVKSRVLGQIDTKEKHMKIQGYAEEVLELLNATLPKLLKSETFFSNVFNR